MKRLWKYTQKLNLGALTQAPDSAGSTIDLIFLTYWLPPIKGAQLVLERDVQCISDKLKKALASKGISKIFSYILISN